MKIYINNLNLDVLESTINKLNDYFNYSEEYIQIYSIEGIFKITEKNIKKLKPVDKEIQIINNYYENFTLIVDSSYFQQEVETSIPSEHISVKIMRSYFKYNKKSILSLVIESDKSLFTPTDLYFEVNENIDINDALVKKEIIVFLSLLN